MSYTHVMARCSMKLTGPPIIRDTALAFQSTPLLCFPFGSKEDKENEDVVQIIVKPCFDALPPLLLLLFKHEPFLSSPLFLQTTKPQFDMQVLPPSRSHTHTILDCGRESASLAPCYNFLSTYIIHVCLWLCVRERRKSGKVEAAADENHRAKSNHNNSTVTNITRYQL